jgi:regulator of protease activity HflC (stomatin/prohibitin superfamily)
VQVGVDGILYLKVLESRARLVRHLDYIFAITQLAQTTLRSEVGKIDLDRTFEERTHINSQVVTELDKASEAWGVKVLRYEIKKHSRPPRRRMRGDGGSDKPIAPSARSARGASRSEGV